MPMPNANGFYDYQQHIADAVLYGMGVHGIPYRDFFKSPPLHDAIDFDRGPDGVWRLPRVWADGDTIHFGIDPAQPGSDRTAYWFARKG